MEFCLSYLDTCPMTHTSCCLRKDFNPYLAHRKAFPPLWWQPIPVLLPRKSRRQKGLVGYSPWGHNQSDTVEHTCRHTHTPCRLGGSFCWCCKRSGGPFHFLLFSPSWLLAHCCSQLPKNLSPSQHPSPPLPHLGDRNSRSQNTKHGYCVCLICQIWSNPRLPPRSLLNSRLLQQSARWPQISHRRINT